MVYFVRHGESEGNTSPVFMDDAVPLTAVGRAQAEAVAMRCTKLPVEVIVASTMPRAIETAEIINAKIGKPMAYSDLFVERRRPSDLLGKDKKHPDTVAVQKAMRHGFGHIAGYRFSDEEDFAELKARAYAALDYLAGMTEENILVATHGWFMRIMVACAVFGAELTDRECKRFVDAFAPTNTGITVFTYDEKRVADGNTGPWRILTWNDHAHLG